MNDKNEGECKYEGEVYSEGSEVCQAGRVMVCYNGEWGDTGRDCKDSNDVIDLPPITDFTGEKVDNKPIIDDDVSPLREYVRYSLKRNMYRDGDKIYGRYSSSIAQTCNGGGLLGYIHRLQISSMTSRGRCSGQEVIKIDYEG